MATGTVKTILIDKGFGFIAPDEGGDGRNSDLFFHHSSVQDGRIDDYQQGDRVSYEAGPDSRDPSRSRATNVRRISE